MCCREYAGTVLLLASSVVALAAVPAAGRAQEPAGPTETEGADAAGGTLEVITVTATKRPERLRDIAGSVTAFDEQGLEVLGAQSFADYLTRTPGVVFNQAVPGNSAAIIRGVATTTGIAQAQGTTGYFINDVPLTDPFYSGGIPDIDTFDVRNVAILRGPQGTLFGSASLGGAINYQAETPDLDAFDLHLRATARAMEAGDDGYNGHIMLNAPVAPGVFAVRGVFNHRHDAGYVDNIGTGEHDSNRTKLDGGRLLATLVPADDTTITYLFLKQKQRTRDAGSSEPAIGPYSKSTQVPEPFSYETTIHNLRLDQQLDFATLTMTATRHEKVFSGQQDFSGLVPAFAPAVFLEPGTSKGNTFEVRLVSTPGERLEYLVGLFHDSTREVVINQLIAPSAVPLFGTDLLLDATVRIEGNESAVFGEVSYDLTEHLELTAGGRWFETGLDTVTEQQGPLVGGTVTTAGESSERGLTPKVSLTWQPNDQYLLYALISKGFRFGGPNITSDPTFAIPEQFDSDTLVNYEIGTRTTWLDQRLRLDGTLFYVDWDDIQVSLRSPGGLIYTDNAGEGAQHGLRGDGCNPTHCRMDVPKFRYLAGCGAPPRFRQRPVPGAEGLDPSRRLEMERCQLTHLQRARRFVCADRSVQPSLYLERTR